MARRKPLKTSDSAKELLKDEEIFGDTVQPMDTIAQPFNQEADGIPNGTDRDGTEWVGDGIEVDTSVPKNGVFN